MTTVAIEAEYQVIEMVALVLSATNPRQSFDRTSLDELKASIRESGIQVPLLVRTRQPDGGGDGVYAADEPMYEVVAGARRFRAATELGMDEIPCLVRELTDDEARDAQIVENLQRADVPAKVAAKVAAKKPAAKKKGTLSPESRKRIAAAMKKRWSAIADAKKGGKK
jgi:ParB/RepB/Spo0J family partition protein